MKKQWIKKISIVISALLLLAILPMSAMAEKETASESKVTKATATVSDAEEDVATSSDAYEDGELLDGQVHDDLPAEAVPAEDLKPAELEAVPETEPAAVPAEVTEKQADLDITGTWTVDNITTYRFEENGKGELLLPEHTYSFDYAVEENELTMEFEDDDIKTAVFTITLEEDTLTLKREEEAGTAEFTLEKTAD